MHRIRQEITRQQYLLDDMVSKRVHYKLMQHTMSFAALEAKQFCQLQQVEVCQNQKLTCATCYRSSKQTCARRDCASAMQAS